MYLFFVLFRMQKKKKCSLTPIPRKSTQLSLFQLIFTFFYHKNISANECTSRHFFIPSNVDIFSHTIISVGGYKTFLQ